MPVKLDLHTHSSASADGGISFDSYEQTLKAGKLDCIAITDHNRIDLAVKIQSKLGSDKIIVGEEISTKQGDIIGLYLVRNIHGGMDITQAITEIKKQGGLVYVPHPFETVRHGISKDTLKSIITSVDIIESSNGRALFQNYGPDAHSWAVQHSIPAAASSDAHRKNGLGRTYTLVDSIPTSENLCRLLSNGRYRCRHPSIGDIIAPKVNRLQKLIKLQKGNAHE